MAAGVDERSTVKFSKPLGALLFAALVFTGCESTDSGSSSHTTVYYGAAFYDPWYHGDYDHDHDVVVTPPGNRPPLGDRPPLERPPGGGFAPRPEHPIAKPPGESYRPSRPSTLPSNRPPSVSTRPAPSIPSTPRAAPRGGGGRR